MMHNIEKICIHYEKFNEDLEEALENAASKEYKENISTSGGEVENNNFGFFDPDCDENLKQYDIGLDLGIGTKKKAKNKMISNRSRLFRLAYEQ